MSTLPTPRVYFHFRSPFSRLGLHALAQSNVSVEHAVFLGPPQGVAFADPMGNPAKAAYYRQDVPRMTGRMGLPLTLPGTLDTDFDPAIRAFCACNAAGCGPAFALAVSNARWGEGKNVSDLAVLKACAEQVGAGPALVDAAQSDPAVDTALEQTRGAIERDQVFGVPFVVWGDAKYWGHDRIDVFLEDYALFSSAEA